MFLRSGNVRRGKIGDGNGHNAVEGIPCPDTALDGGAERHCQALYRQEGLFCREKQGAEDCAAEIHELCAIFDETLRRVARIVAVFPEIFTRFIRRRD